MHPDAPSDTATASSLLRRHHQLIHACEHTKHLENEMLYPLSPQHHSPVHRDRILKRVPFSVTTYTFQHPNVGQIGLVKSPHGMLHTQHASAVHVLQQSNTSVTFNQSHNCTGSSNYHPRYHTLTTTQTTCADYPRVDSMDCKETSSGCSTQSLITQFKTTQRAIKRCHRKT